MSAETVRNPSYYHREYENDLNFSGDGLLKQCKRVALVALPFFSLYKPFGCALSFSLGGMRSVCNFIEFVEAGRNGELTNASYALFQTSLALIAVAGTAFSHPLGMLLTTIHDCALDTLSVGQHLWMGEFREALGSYASLTNNTLYLALFLKGGVEVAVASLAMQVFMGLARSVSDYQDQEKGKLEVAGHLLMAMIRSKQLCGHIHMLQRVQPKRTLKENSMTAAGVTRGNIFHSLANYLQRPVQLATEGLLRAICTPIRPGEAGNWTNPALEKVHRCSSVFFSIATAPLTVSSYILGEGVHKIGNLINGVPYTYRRGLGEEKSDWTRIKAMTLNACMLWGGLPIPLGGVRSPGERMEQLIELIREQDPDILFLQEMSFPAAEALFDGIKANYAHYYSRIDPNFLKMESGLTIFSKLPITNVESFRFPDQFGIYRGAFLADTPAGYFVTAHLEAGMQKKSGESSLS